MDTRPIPLSEFQADLEGMLLRCYDSGETVVIALPDRGLVSIQPVVPDDDLVNELIEQNAPFRELLTRSLASPREPFPFVPAEPSQTDVDQSEPGRTIDVPQS